MTNIISSLAAPLAITAASLIAVFSKKASPDDFLLGTKNGISTCISILPTMIMLVVSVNMLSSSGFTSAVSSVLSPFLTKLGIPSEIIPLVIMRPFSGGGSNALIAEIFEKHGADSFAGRCASIILGSSDTIIYIISIYFSAVNIKKTRHAIPAAIATMIFCVFFSTFICRIMFS